MMLSTYSIPLIGYIFIAQFLAFFVKGLAGFGNPLISNPMLSMSLDNRIITPGNLLMDTPVNAYIAWKNRHSFSMKKTLPITLAVMAGIVPGTYLLSFSVPWVLKALLGVLVIAIGVEMLTRNPNKKFRQNTVLMVAISFVSGICSGLFGINMLFLAYLERTAADRSEFRGNVCFVFLVDNVFRVINYFFLGMFTKESILLFLISIPAIFLGLFIGSKVDKRLDEAKVKKVIILMFLLGGVSILVKALLFRA